MYENTGKPSLAKFRCRLQVMAKASHSGALLAARWNPKGRNFELQRDLMKFFAANEQATEILLESMRRPGLKA